MSFNQEFDEHGAWRKQFALRLKLLAEWLNDHDLMDPAIREELEAYVAGRREEIGHDDP